MKTSRTLRHELALFISVMTIGLVSCYSILLPIYFFTGVTESSAIVLEIEAKTFEQSRENNPSTPLPSTSTIQGYIGIESVPDNIQAMFPLDTHRHREMLSNELISEPNETEGDLILFFPYQLRDKKMLYLVEHIPESALRNREQIFDINTLLITLWAVGLGFLIAWIAGTVWMLRRIHRRTGLLSQWAMVLRADKNPSEHPDFGYKEFNDIAYQLKDAFCRVADSVDREHHFLRNASHELRTPITIIQSNIELIEHRNHANEDSVAFARIKRAAGNMKQLTETLLWLTRETKHELPTVRVSLDEMIRDLIHDNMYLLKGKSVSVDFSESGVVLQVAQTPCRIAISNLIQNAFQYTQNGIVDIRLSPQAFTIRNHGTDDEPHSNSLESEQGYGLGLLLVQQIVERMGWDTCHRSIPGGRETTITFTNSNAV